MGRVFLGYGPDGRLVAVKQVGASVAEEDGFLARFRQEVAASFRIGDGTAQDSANNVVELAFIPDSRTLVVAESYHRVWRYQLPG